MSPEYGATCGIFPVDAETLRYLEFTGRPPERVELVEAYSQGAGALPRRRLRGADLLATRSSSTWRRSSRRSPARSARRTACRSREAARGASERGARRTRARTARAADRRGAAGVVPGERPAVADDGRRRAGARPQPRPRPTQERARAGDADDGSEFELDHGAVVIAAITSCTNTSNPSVMLGAGLLAKKARRARPDAQAVGEDEPRAGLEGRHRVPGQGRADRAARASSASTSSATAAPPASATRARCRRRSREAIAEHDLAVCSVLSGNRNFEGRIHPEVKMNYLASPPLCVAYALAGRMDIDLLDEPLGQDTDGEDVYLRDIWPTQQEVARGDRAGGRVGHVPHAATARCSRATRTGTALEVPEGDRYAWDRRSTYVKRPPYFEGMPAEPPEGFERRSPARACSRCSATASPPTTSRRPARSRRTRPAGATCRARRRAAATSTPTARGAATTR